MKLYDQIEEARAHIRARTGFQARSAIVLGTGLAGFADEVLAEAEFDYSDIPHFVPATAPGHKGKLVFGHLGTHPVAVMAGRLHFYEGWTMAQVTFPVRVLAALGVERIVVTNVSGGVNPHLRGGDLVVVRDHINLLPENPLRGENDERLGPRFPDLSAVYDPEMRRLALEIAREHGIRAREGVYSALQGPNLETPAEYAMLRLLGSDCTGMSSVPEVLVAKHSGLKIMMLSLVTNVSFPPSAIREVSVEDVLKMGRAAEPNLRKVVREMLQRV